MPIYSSDSDGVPPTPKKLFGREKPLHAILGGGKAADMILWRDRNLSAAMVIGSTVLWSLLEVGDYNCITLLCYISIIMMFTLLIWSSGSRFVDWNPPNPRAITIPESTFRWLFSEINRILHKFFYISSGKDLKTFFLTVVFLWILAGVGNYFSSLNLLYTGFVLLMSVPALYERYQEEVDYLASKGSRDAKKLYKKLDTRFLNKIPRGPVKEKKNF